MSVNNLDLIILLLQVPFRSNTPLKMLLSIGMIDSIMYAGLKVLETMKIDRQKNPSSNTVSYVFTIAQKR